jgi:hypothetical protein
VGVPGFDVKLKRHKESLIFILLISLGLFAAGCKVGVGEVREEDDSDSVPTGRVISGEEALSLYGVDSETEVEPEDPRITPEPWFPMQVWVSASILPYGDPDPILVLPVCADSELGVSSTWVGDLEAGSSVMLLSVHADGSVCYIEGKAFQGWEVEGWVACNRFLFHEPTPIVSPDE